MRRRFLVRHGTGATEAASEGDRVEIGGRTFAVEPGGADRWRVLGDHRSVVASVLTEGDVTWVHVDGVTYRLVVDEAERAARARPPVEHELLAPMPATVRAVQVSEGDRVQAGDLLLTLEAMKMELPIRAPRGGVVSSIRYRAGDLVQAGDLLLDLE
jgi:biotin carboxyl carrier protein